MVRASRKRKLIFLKKIYTLPIQHLFLRGVFYLLLPLHRFFAYKFKCKIYNGLFCKSH